jgi:hypothetical protein
MLPHGTYFAAQDARRGPEAVVDVDADVARDAGAADAPAAGDKEAGRRGLTAAEQAQQARDGYRFCAAMTMRHHAAEAIRLGAERDFWAASRQWARAASHLGAYVRGSPGPWHK